ncbi:MAG: ABC transporter permease subunit, partial [Betaproteobacteria bacterium]|nr:ABC transporter permease subunit [Betaproteobacteria bacterium]
MSGPVTIPLHRNPAVRAWLTQIVVIGLAIWAVATIYANTVANLNERGIKTSIAFMSEVAPFAFPLNFTPFWEIVLGESKYWEIFIAGVQNTILVSLMGIPAATFLGIAIGIARLSPNWIVRKLTSIYIEIFRNTPLLLQLLFWAFAVFPIAFNKLPPARDSIIIGNTVINSSGIYLPHYSLAAPGWAIMAGCASVAAAAIWLLAGWARRRQDATGKSFPVLLSSIVICIILLGFGLLASAGWGEFEFPVKKGFNYQGGIRPPIQLLVLWTGLTLYTAAFIAENVRGGILAVNKGQTEAAMALGLYRTLRLKLVILPQALRVIIPPTISQYLNLTKNSSLAVAIGYPDLYNIWTGVAPNQTGQSLII